jgi:hypothetical protein
LGRDLKGLKTLPGYRYVAAPWSAALLPHRTRHRGTAMGWEYQVVKSESSDAFLAALNALGGDGWEAISGGFGMGESKRVSLGQGMPMQTAAGAPMWLAVVKRALAATTS